MNLIIKGIIYDYSYMYIYIKFDFFPQALCTNQIRRSKSEGGVPDSMVRQYSELLLPFSASLEGSLLLLTFLLTVRCYPVVNKSPSSPEVRTSMCSISRPNALSHSNRVPQRRLLFLSQAQCNTNL